MIMVLLKYKLLPLKNLSARRVAAELFKESTILTSMSNSPSDLSLSNNSSNLELWRKNFEDAFKKEIEKLKLPEVLSYLIHYVSKPMFTQARHWKKLHENYFLNTYDDAYFECDTSILEKLCWTTAGMVDYRKTAEALIQSNAIDVVKKFKLACLYCLEDSIRILWKALPDKNKRYFHSEKKSRLESGGWGQEFWWPYIVEGEETKLNNLTRSYRRDQVTFHQYAFLSSAEKGNKAAVEHFYQKITNEEKEGSVVSAAVSVGQIYSEGYFENIVFPYEKYTELLSYLLSLMSPDQKDNIFKENPFGVFGWFLACPFQEMFLENAVTIWNLLSHDNSETLLSIICENSENGDDTVRFLQNFFLRIPPAIVDQQCKIASYFHSVLLYENIKAFQILFRSLDAAARTKLILSEMASDIFKELIREGKEDFVQACLREASHEDKERLKHILDITEMKLKTRKWSALFHDGTNKGAKGIQKIRHQL